MTSTERGIVRNVIRALKANGTPIVKVYDGEEFVPVNGERETMEVIYSVDEAFIYTKSGQWVRLVLGEGTDVICDYVRSLEPVIDPIIENIID